MSTKLNWEGIYPAVLTPFTKEGGIDFEMFAKNTEAQIKAGVHGIILAGTLGEASALETEEKFELLKYAKKLRTEESQLFLIFQKIQQKRYKLCEKS